jgi:hypothetical protein
MMRNVYARSTLIVGAAIATAAIGWASPAGAAPTGHSPSYQNGYDSEHSYYAIPRNHTFLASEMRRGLDTVGVCQLEMDGGAPPPDPADWMRGCIDALHDLGFMP